MRTGTTSSKKYKAPPTARPVELHSTRQAGSRMLLASSEAALAKTAPCPGVAWHVDLACQLARWASRRETFCAFCTKARAHETLVRPGGAAEQLCARREGAPWTSHGHDGHDGGASASRLRCPFVVSCSASGMSSCDGASVWRRACLCDACESGPVRGACVVEAARVVCWSEVLG